MQNFINHLPKAELHVHIVGTLEPAMLIRIARRNCIDIDAHIEKLHAYPAFNTLAGFLAVYDHAVRVLKTEEDFYDITFAYLHKAAQQGVLRSEFFFEVQNFEPLGVSFSVIINGIMTAIAAAQKKYGISSAPILCFLRDMSEASALHAFKQSLAYKDAIIACGLASHERGNPPLKFQNVFAQAHNEGYKTCIHAGEDAGASYVRQAIFDLHADRIDHGIRSVEDPELIDYLVKTRIPLTVCPLSNKALNICKPQAHPLAAMLDAGLNVSLHSDDPAFFGGYINENYAYAHHKMGLTRAQLITCARNSLISSFANEQEKAEMLDTLEKYVNKHAH